MSDQSKVKDFNFRTMITNFSGYVSSWDKTNVAENILVRGSQNVYKKLSGTISVRQGEKLLGVANTTASPVSSEYVWYTSGGNTYTLVISNSILYVVVNNIWYPLVGSLTKTRYVFDKWWDNSLKQNVCLFVNGDSNIYKWNGGFGLISTTTANTIVLDRTIALSFMTSASGTVVVNGTTYTYTGSGGSTLTGVTPNPTGEANGSGVLQSIDTTSNKPDTGVANDFIKVIGSQLYVGSYISSLLYMSQDTDYTNFTVPSPQLMGSPGRFVMDGNLKGIGVRQGNACVGFGQSGWAIISFTQISNNNVLVRDNKIDIKPVAILQAPLAHEFIGTVGDNLVYLGQDQQVRQFGDFNTAFVAMYPSLSQEVARELQKETFTGGCLKCIGEFIYVVAPNSGKVYLRQERTRVDPNGTVVSEKLWHSPFIWNISRIDQIDGTIVGFSNANPQIYQLWDTNQWHDDSPSGEYLPYTCVMALGYRGEGRRQGLWSFDKFFSEGYIATGTTLNLLMNYNYQGALNAINAVINSISQPAYIFGTDLVSLGENSLGDESLGNGGITDIANDQDSLPKFKCINSLGLANCFEWQPVIYSDQKDAQWEILAVSDNATAEPDQNATFIINKKKN